MSQNQQDSLELSSSYVEQLYLLSDIDEKSNLYKIFGNDIKLINDFILLDQYANKLNNPSELQEFIISTNFQDFKELLENLISNKRFESFIVLLNLFSYLFEIRPKLLPIIVLLIPILFNSYPSSFNDIKKYILKNCYKTYFYTFIHQIYFKDLDIEQFLVEQENQTKILNVEEIYQEIINKNLCLALYDKEINVDPTINEPEETLIKIIFNDDCDELVSFTTKYPLFNLKTKIRRDMHPQLSDILPNILITPINLCCFFGSVKCFKYLFLNARKFNIRTNV